MLTRSAGLGPHPTLRLDYRSANLRESPEQEAPETAPRSQKDAAEKQDTRIKAYAYRSLAPSRAPPSCSICPGAHLRTYMLPTSWRRLKLRSMGIRERPI